MEISGQNGSVWELDESLKEVAAELVTEYTESLGHIDLRHVIFVRTVGGRKADWLGKCYYVKDPYTIISHFVFDYLKDYIPADTDVEYTKFLDVSYIIAIHEDNLQLTGGDIKMLERGIIHHELMHIKQNMEGIERHNIKDFAPILSIYGIRWASGSFSSEILDESSD